VDEIDGIAPPIAIRQKNTTRNPRSTVATSTEIYDFLRLLFARAGQTWCRRARSRWCATPWTRRRDDDGGTGGLALVRPVPDSP